MKRTFLTLLAIAISLCTATAGTSSPVSDTARSDAGMVVSPEANASRIGADVLRNGGNAIDATIAVAFALAVTNPQAGGLGGGGFAIIREADGSYRALDFRERAPKALEPQLFLDADGKPISGLSTSSGLAVGVPGLVAGLEELHAAGASQPWAALLKPAIALAEDGFESYEHLKSATGRALSNIRRDARSSALFLDDAGEPRPVGSLIRQPELGRTLRRISRRGADGFYRGAVAKSIVRATTRRGGVIRRSDLADYRVAYRTPLVGSYRGHKIVSFPPPSSGGVVLLQILAMLERQAEVAPFHSLERIHQLAEIERRAYADRSKWLGDPDFVDTPITSMLAPDYIRSRAATIEMERATPSSEIAPGVLRRESTDTLHFSITDGEGRAISLTTTLNTNFGSAIFAGPSGVILNNEMDDFALAPGVPNTYGLVGGRANAVEPGKRPLSSMAPTIVESPNHSTRPFLVIGSPGGGMIITSVAQVIVNVIDHQMDLQRAVDAERFHHQWLPDSIQCESPCFGGETREALEKLGHKVIEVGSIGNVNVIGIDADGGYIGAADRRRGGSAAAP